MEQKSIDGADVGAEEVLDASTKLEVVLEDSEVEVEVGGGGSLGFAVVVVEVGLGGSSSPPPGNRDFNRSKMLPAASIWSWK